MRRGAQFARDSANFATPDLLFTSLPRGGSPSSRETVPSSWRLTYYLLHFCEAGRPVCERQCQLRGAEPIIYVTSARRVAQYARDSSKFIDSTEFLPYFLRGDLTPYLRHFPADFFCCASARSLVFGEKLGSLSRDKRPGRGKIGSSSP